MWFFIAYYELTEKGEFKMTVIVFAVAIIICGACEEVARYYGFNLEKKIRELQFNSWQIVFNML